MATLLSLNVSHGQIAVFDATLNQPFNDWTDRNFLQGFTWSLGSVSFRAVVENGLHLIEIDIVENVGDVHPEAIRVLEVPFEISANGAIEIGSIAETVPLSLKMVKYLLRCEFLHPAGARGDRVRMSFGQRDPLRFAIVRADPELSATGELLTTAHPAPG